MAKPCEGDGRDHCECYLEYGEPCCGCGNTPAPLDTREDDALEQARRLTDADPM